MNSRLAHCLGLAALGVLEIVEWPVVLLLCLHRLTCEETD